MRFVGDQYVRAEFRSHKNVTDRRFLEPFFQQWTSYLELLKEQTHSMDPAASGARIGKHLDSEMVEKLDDDKAEQLLELHQASIGADESDANVYSNQGNTRQSGSAQGSPKRA
ncbi:acetate non-utilizing protein 9 [Coemansia sp. Benny D115]|nr:acetate non-utilizing protein 9 [Coemansia sp. Benny D115]